MNSIEQERQLWERGEWEHLPFSIMEAYVNEKLDAVDREVVEGHLTICDSCLAEVRSNRAMHDQLQAEATPIVTQVRPDSRNRRPALIGLLSCGLGGVFLTLLTLRLAPSDDTERKRRLDQVMAANARQQQELRQRTAERDELRTALLREQRKIAVVPSTTPPATPLRGIVGNARTLPTQPPARMTESQRATPGLMVPSSVMRLLAQKRLNLPDLSALATNVVAVRGDDKPSSVLLIAPVQTRLITARPLLRWQPVAGAVSYEVWVADSKGSPIETANNITGTYFQPTKALPEGQMLQWEVHAIATDGTEQTASTVARFAVLPAGQARRLADQRQPLVATAPLAWGMIAAEAGLWEDAETTFRQILESPRTKETERKKAWLFWKALQNHRKATGKAEAESNQ